jgi:hypothetical protein
MRSLISTTRTSSSGVGRLPRPSLNLYPSALVAVLSMPS